LIETDKREYGVQLQVIWSCKETQTLVYCERERGEPGSSLGAAKVMAQVPVQTLTHRRLQNGMHIGKVKFVRYVLT
jgi:hypothetical protein